MPLVPVKKNVEFWLIQQSMKHCRLKTFTLLHTTLKTMLGSGKLPEFNAFKILETRCTTPVPVMENVQILLVSVERFVGSSRLKMCTPSVPN